MGRPHRIPRKLTVLVVVALSLGIFEIVANRLFATNGRIIVPRGRILFVPDENLSYGLKPNVNMPAADNYAYPGVTVQTNSLGLRDDPPESWRARRILIVGDSNTFGFGVNADETFSKRFQQLLRTQSQDVSVINAGVPGFNVWQIGRRIRQLVPRIRPERVIYAAYLNDIEPEYQLHLGGQTVRRLPFYPGEQRTREDAAWDRRWHWFTPVLIRRTADYLLSGGSRPIIRVFRSDRRFGQDSEENNPASTAVQERQAETMNRLVRQFDYLAGDWSEVRQRWTLAHAEISRIHRDLADSGVKFQVAVLPFRCQIEDRTLPRRLQTELLEYCRSEGIEVVDLTPALDRHSDQILYLDHDYHPSSLGHQIIAEAMWESLR